MKTKLDIAWATRCKLRAEGDKLWADAITEVCGAGVSVEWDDEGNCTVAKVMVFLYEGVQRE